MSGIHKVYRRDNQPYAQIPNEAIRDPKMSANAFRLLAYLMSHQDGYELTYGQIESQTGLGRYAINHAVENLTELGWLETSRPKLANGQFGSKDWYVLDPTTVGNSTVGNSTMEYPTDKEDNSFKKNINKKSCSTEVEHAFEVFWETYPKKAAKIAARKAFEKAFKEHGNEVLEGAVRFANDPNLPVKTFIPLPATWLNRGSWGDEPLPERVVSPEEREAKAAQLLREANERRRLEIAAEEKARAEAYADYVPATRCEHGRVKVICDVCSGKTIRKAADG